MSKYITEMQRYKIEFLLKKRVPVKEIAREIGKHFTTVYKEIKKGTIELQNGDLSYRKEYCADYAQRIHEEVSHNKGIDIKLGHDYCTADKIESLIKEKNYSPYAVSCELKKDEQCTSLCAATIYSYINNGYLNITNSDLPYGKQPRKEKEKKRRPSLKNIGARSIEERPKEIYNRDIYGHWEMDTVYSGKDKGLDCLLVLTERATREEVIVKMPDRTKASTVAALDMLERNMGTIDFIRTFKTITIDNGVEFLDFNGIERSCLIDGKRTAAYYCHPYCSSERASNENQNRLIRRFIKKGESISEYNEEDILHIQDWINNLPRRIFGGLSSIEYKKVILSV
ncbi:IS30 family transposase [Eubacterium sp.]|uniref:IS30 family transposase n=1 Tax=Eubacterium sp. TaxID=142586 RepID=UPI0026DEB9CB|nr:IS30 family transposase [Eubacterium sp.]MDO5434487.1 IS30 family transposase [Eubacterium sp.]